MFTYTQDLYLFDEKEIELDIKEEEEEVIPQDLSKVNLDVNEDVYVIEVKGVIKSLESYSYELSLMMGYIQKHHPEVLDSLTYDRSLRMTFLRSGMLLSIKYVLNTKGLLSSSQYSIVMSVLAHHVWDVYKL